MLLLLNVRTQATESAEALAITTFVATMSTNLGGQAVTTSICEVYLKSDAIMGVDDGLRIVLERVRRSVQVSVFDNFCQW